MSDRAAIAGFGRVLGPDVLAGVQALYREEQERLALLQPAAAVDQAYGADPRQRLDLYLPDAATGLAPVMLWVHGGGFLRGGKGGAGDPWNAHAGRWAARGGVIGAVMTYRLAPDHGWPAGSLDIGAAVDWLAANAARFGGDPTRIVAVGTSAGAAHVAGHLRERPDAAGLAGAALLSGLYGYTPLDERDTTYYGAPDAYPQRWSREALRTAKVPLLAACSEFDPPRFQAEFAGLLADRLDATGRLPPAMVAAGHNHFSLAYHLGAATSPFADTLMAFVRSADTAVRD